MACKYIIKSPSGGEIIIPATFDLISNKDIDVNYWIDSIKTFSDFDKDSLTKDQEKEFKSVSSNLFSSLRKKTASLVSDKFIKDSIDKNYKEPELIIQEINDQLKSFGGYSNLAVALQDYISKDKGNLQEIFEALNQPIIPTYFKGLSQEGLLDLTSLDFEKKSIEERVMENLEFGFPNEITENLSNFLKALEPKYKDLLQGNTLVKSKSIHSARAFNVDGFTFFKGNNDLSLFQGVFKKVASDVNKDSLYNILERFKEKTKIEIPSYQDFNVFEFFNGKLEAKEIEPGLFDSMLDLSKDSKVKGFANEIISLVSNSLNPSNSKLETSIKKLFWELTPETYGETALKEEKRQADFRINEERAEIEQRNRLLADFLEKASQDKNANYSETEEISEDLYNNLKENITIGQDIVEFPFENREIGFHGVVTFIAPRPNGVVVYGIRKNQFGDAEQLKFTFEAGKHKIKFRKFEKAQAEYNPLETVTPNESGMVIDVSKQGKQSIIKDVLRKGDLVNKELLVVGVHPGEVVAQSRTTGKIFRIPYKKVSVIKSEKAKLDYEAAQIKEIKKYSQISDPNLLSKGDLFFDEAAGFYKQILYTDKDNIFYWVTPKGKDAIIKSKPRSDIKKGLASATESLNESELLKVSSEYGKIGKSSASMSSFTTQALAKNGDYFVIQEGNDIKVGKVTDSANRKGIIFNVSAVKSEPIIYSEKDLTFLTDRDISTKYSLTIARVNDWDISVLGEDQITKSHREVKYVIPKSMSKDDLTLWPSLYGNFGKYVDKDTPLGENEVDVTKTMIQLIENSGIEVKNAKLYAQTVDSEGKTKMYKRNQYSLHKINNFDKLSTEVKQELGVLHPGVYFTIYTEKNIDSNIYRIMEVSEGFVTAQLNKVSPDGKLLTFQKRFSIDELLKSKNVSDTSNPVNSIAQLYLQYGESNFKLVTQAVNESLSPTQVKNQKEINVLLDKMKKKFETIGVEVAQVSSEEGNFQNGQKAKIETYVENDRTKTRILLNRDFGLADDLVHETLHIYLTLLRYTDTDLYYSLVNSVLGNDPNAMGLNVTDLEEEFVKKVSSSIQNGEDLLVDNLRDFLVPLMTAIKDLNPDADIDINKALDNPLSELNKPLRSVFNVNVDSSHPMYNLSLITTEPAMREWMAKEKITLKC